MTRNFAAWNEAAFDVLGAAGSTALWSAIAARSADVRDGFAALIGAGPGQV